MEIIRHSSSGKTFVRTKLRQRTRKKTSGDTCTINIDTFASEFHRPIKWFGQTIVQTRIMDGGMTPYGSWLRSAFLGVSLTLTLCWVDHKNSISTRWVLTSLWRRPFSSDKNTLWKRKHYNWQSPGANIEVLDRCINMNFIGDLWHFMWLSYRPISLDPWNRLKSERQRTTSGDIIK